MGVPHMRMLKIKHTFYNSSFRIVTTHLASGLAYVLKSVEYIFLSTVRNIVCAQLVNSHLYRGSVVSVAKFC